MDDVLMCGAVRGRRQVTTTEPITEKQLRKQVAAIVEPYGFTVDSFLAADLAEIEDDRLRDLWLMVKGALPLTAEAEVACCPDATCSGCPEPTYCESLRPAGALGGTSYEIQQARGIAHNALAALTEPEVGA
jgi:hypothetical protein